MDVVEFINNHKRERERERQFYSVTVTHKCRHSRNTNNNSGKTIPDILMLRYGNVSALADVFVLFQDRLHSEPD